MESQESGWGEPENTEEQMMPKGEVPEPPLSLVGSVFCSLRGVKQGKPNFNVIYLCLFVVIKPFGEK